MSLVVQRAQAAAFLTNSPLTTARAYHTATLLINGKVLVAGGYNDNNGALSSAELYEPATGIWTRTGSMTSARYHHTATLLQNGQVLVVGGAGTNGILPTTELYDPVTEKWTTSGILNTARDLHTATLLQTGQLLVAGGEADTGSILSSAELYNPTNGSWTTTISNLNTARYEHTATLLPNGQVIIVGGFGTNGILSSSELYDPVARTWTASGGLNTARYQHTATLLPEDGRVLITGGEGVGGVVLGSAELYSPSIGWWGTSHTTLTTARENHTATVLPNGQVLLMGGFNYSNGYVFSTELYNYPFEYWGATAGQLNTARENHTATLLANGQLLVTGGTGDSDVLSSTERYDSAVGAWSPTGTMTTLREHHTATLLTNGTVLVAGGYSYYSQSTVTNTEVYSPASKSWALTGPLNMPREYYTATLLPNGEVLIAGGASDFFNSLNTAEMYNPTNGQWTLTGPMSDARESHTATLLPNGKVLVAGGAQTYFGALPSAELFDPVQGTWTPTGSLGAARVFHTATLLPNGKVLVAGGGNGNLGAYLSSAELYDPETGLWNPTGPMTTEHAYHTATLLPNGKVLVASGDASGTGAELYDPVTEKWTPTGSLNMGRDGGHTATLLLNGEVLVDGGYSGGNNAELYDPSTGSWALIASLTSQRAEHTATLLPSGRLLVAGGVDSGYYSAEVFDTGLGFNGSLPWQPQILTVVSPLILTSNLALTASGLRGISEASSGDTQDSSSDYPLVQLRSMESGQTLFVASTNWSANSFNSTSVTNFPTGYALATLFVNGNPSRSTILAVTKAAAVVSLNSLTQIYDGTAKSVTATTMPSGLLVNFTYNGPTNAPVNAGNYVVVGTVSDANYQGSATNTLVINPAQAIVTLGDLSQTYDGSAKSVSVTTAPPNLSVAVTYNGVTNAPINAGSYAVIGTVIDPNGQGSATNTLIITPAAANVILGNLLQTFDGTEKTVSVTTVPPGLSVALTYNGSSTPPINVGSYTVIGTVNDPNGQGIAINMLVIGKAAGTVAFGNLSQTYDGTAKMVSVTTTPPGLPVTVTYNGSTNPPTAVGSYTVIGTINDATYQGIGINTLVIGKATGTVSISNLLQTYDGTVKTVSITTAPPGLSVNVTYNGSSNAPTNAGSYTVIGTINDFFYQGIATSLLVVSKATGAVTLGNLIQVFDGTPKNVSTATLPPGLSVSVFYNGLTNAPTNEGSYTVLGTINDVDYLGSATNTLVVGVPVVLSPELLSNGVFRLLFTETPGAIFTVLATTNLALPIADWTALGTPTETSPGQFQFTDPEATNFGWRLYRIRSQ
jgi:N-acetylneuraminic acid mutarotase